MIQTILSEQATRVMLSILTTLALVMALQFGQQILAPMVFALVLGVVVSPLADRLSGLGVPRLVIAVVLLALSTAFTGAALLLVEPLVGLLIDELPRIKAVAAYWLETASGLLRGIEEISQEIGESVGAEDVDPQTAIPTVSDALWLAPSFLSQVFIFVGTLFFFVLTRNDIYAKTGALEGKLRKADRAVSRYFAAVTLVNVGLGCATAGVLMAIGVEYAVLWGLAAGLLNYILYLGPLMVILALTIAGMIQFIGFAALLPPAAFLTINMLEANFVTPLVVGKRLAMNPLIVFLAIIFGLWIWGPIGAIVALPVLLWFGVMLRPELVLSDLPQRRRIAGLAR
ncbi:AI-2E family transporter [Thalassococcus sp. CAU 1522]|uniref:AI-2E family transporter n=1 Tax=Thalassococcus arenae TaxID=2851652 RepID=A0ABS6N302_9RHOB|nr:AI-2E family transporter [Thalassococcus arenae]MBV2358399.1 AI-2E family transporter [Thalassococcus arenae]